MTGGEYSIEAARLAENTVLGKALRELAVTDALGADTAKHLTLGPEAAAVVHPAKKLEKADDVMDSGHLQQVWDIVEDLQNNGMPNEEIKKFLHGVADGIEDN